MVTAPASTPSRSWCVQGSVSQLRCWKTGLAEPMAEGSGIDGAAIRTGGASMTRPVPSASSCSARMAAQELTRLQWSPPASARGTRDNTMNPETSLRSRPCRHRGSSTNTNLRAREGRGRTGWVKTGTRLNPERHWTCRVTLNLKKFCLSDVTTRHPETAVVDYMCVTGTWFMWTGSSPWWKTPSRTLRTFLDILIHMLKANMTRTCLQNVLQPRTMHRLSSSPVHVFI